MKKLSTFVCFLSIGTLATAQSTNDTAIIKDTTPKKMNTAATFTTSQYKGNVGIGTESPSVRLDVAGYLRVGSEDPSGDANPVPGMIRYNKDTKKFQGYVGGTNPGWRDLH